MPAQDGKRTRLSDHELIGLINDGRTPDEIADATGISAEHLRTRLRRQGYDDNGAPVDTTPRPPQRKPVVSWYADDDVEWMSLASCFAARTPELWFAKPASQPLAVAEAKRICGSCPVRVKCLDMALKAEGGQGVDSRAGIYGGLTVAERWALGSEAVA